MQKINRTTGNRALDEDIRRLYKQGDDLKSSIASIQTTPAPIPSTPNVSPLPQLSGAITVKNVAAQAVVGVLSSYAREDHVHGGVQSYRGTVILGSPSTTLTITHNLALLTPFLASVGVYSSTGVQQATALATFVFTANGVTITFPSALAADTYSVLVLG